MSHGCATDICKNVLFIGGIDKIKFESVEEKPEEELSNEEFEEYQEKYGTDLEFHIPGSWRMLTHDEGISKWPELVQNGFVRIGRKKRVYLELAFEKEGHFIWLQNVDQYSHVGEYTFVACGPDRKAVEMLAEDLGLNPNDIQDEDTVEQWG